MPELFEKTEINGMTLNNRVIRSATWTGLADETGLCTSRLIDYLVTLARGGVGLIVTGHAYVLKNGQAGPRQLAVDRDAVLPGLQLLTEAVHDNGGKIVLQLSHSGIYGDSGVSGLTPSAVSAKTDVVPYPVDELSGKGVEGIIDAFVAGAKRAFIAGFDGVQIHAGHGYLLSQFLSPAYNTRSDRYGGNLAARATVLLEIVRRIRRCVGLHYPLLVKLNCRDFLQNGLSRDESLQIGGWLEKAGVDALEVSGGTRESGAFKSTRTGIFRERDEAYFEEYARLFKRHLGIPVVLVGGIRSYQTAVRLLGTGAADYVALSRPFIKEPGFVKRWQSGDTAPVACISDNECLGEGLRGAGIGCRWERHR